MTQSSQQLMGQLGMRPPGTGKPGVKKGAAHVVLYRRAAWGTVHGLFHWN